MSKAAKTSIAILMILLIAALGFAVFSFMNLQKTAEEKLRVEQEYADARSRFDTEKKINAQNALKLKDEIAKQTAEKDKALNQIKEVETRAAEDIQEISNKLAEVADDRDKWKRRIDTIKEERDKLMTKITELTKQLEDKDKEIARAATKAAPPSTVEKLKMTTITTPSAGGVVDEQYWANVLADKASLEVKITELEEQISAKSIELVEIKQSNESLKLEVDSLKDEKEQIAAEIQHKTDMIDNITLELARTKNDKKFIADRVSKLNEENGELRQEMKKLVSVKNALEKSIVKITKEKDTIEGQLGKTETIIQSKIDEIWQIKDEIDQSLKSSAQAVSGSNEVELPPIVVSSDDGAVNFNTGESLPDLNGRVISINEANNFVIVDIGEDAGVRLGDNLSVYRDSKYIARLEVIQVRKDISAADLKDQWSKIKVGDVIR